MTIDDKLTNIATVCTFSVNDDGSWPGDWRVCYTLFAAEQTVLTSLGPSRNLLHQLREKCANIGSLQFDWSIWWPFITWFMTPSMVDPMGRPKDFYFPVHVFVFQNIWQEYDWCPLQKSSIHWSNMTMRLEWRGRWWGWRGGSPYISRYANSYSYFW